MACHQRAIHLRTTRHGHMQRIDDQLQAFVDETAAWTGLVNIFNVGSTGAICMIELEPGLEQDLPQVLDRLIPPSRSYGHEQCWHDGNGHSHLQASLLGPSMTLPVREGRLALGTWQQIVHLECDIKPRQRTLIATLYCDDEERPNRSQSDA